MRFSSIFLVSCIFSSGVLGSPRGNAKKHANIIARANEWHQSPAREVAAVDIPAVKGHLRKRCIARNSTSTAIASASALTSPASLPAAVNVAPSPTVHASTSSVEPSPPPRSSEKPTSSPPPPPPSPKPTQHSSEPAPKPSPKPSSASPPPPSSPLPSSSNPTIAGLLSGAPVTGGDITFYTPGLGACGDTNNEGDFIAAAGHGLFDGYPGATANPNHNPICGKKVKISYQGNSVVVAIVDRCGGCDIDQSLDLTPTAFQQLAPLGVGRLKGATWEWQ